MRARGAVGLVVDDPGCFEHEQAKLFELNGGVGNHSFHKLVIRKQSALGAT